MNMAASGMMSVHVQPIEQGESDMDERVSETSETTTTTEGSPTPVSDDIGREIGTVPAPETTEHTETETTTTTDSDAGSSSESGTNEQ